MKKLSIIISMLFIMITAVCAEEVINIEYKNIKPNSKLTYNAETNRWGVNNRASQDYFVKQIAPGSGSYSEFFTPDENFAFTTGCTYEFIHNGNLIGYSNQDLKFYDFTLVDNEFVKRELNEEEVQSLFPDFRIVKISDFSVKTNSLKIKKGNSKYKIIILNDTDMNFYHYSFTSGNAKFKTYPLEGFIEVTKKGMIQFSHFGENSENFPWFILLIR